MKRLREVLDRPGARVIDLCCGTGDLTLALGSRSAAAVFGSDFCHPMLTAAGKKGLSGKIFEADALQLPVSDASLDGVTAAFGFRNFANYERGLNELLRVLKPGGSAAILEFSQPPNATFAKIYNFYSRAILPKVGGALSGSGEAYRYLPKWVRKFPDAEDLAARMGQAGFRSVEFEQR